MSCPKFSITIPAYKSQFLSEAIESVLSQTLTDYELIIVDDCSPYNLKSIVDQYDDLRIHYYRNSKNCGVLNVVDNWNICLANARGEYVICMGDDDKLLCNCLDEYSKLIDKYPNLNVFHAWSEIIDENSKIVSIQNQRPEWESSLSLIWHRWNGRRKQFIGDFCYKRAFLQECGGYFKLPEACASDDITAIMAAHKFGIANTQTPCFQYRESKYTISHGVQDYSNKLRAKMLEKEWMGGYLDSHGKSSLSQLDSIYCSLLFDEFHCHYSKECERLLFKDIESKPRRIFFWMRHCEDYCVTKVKLLEMLIIVVGHKLFARRSIRSTM